MDFPTLNIWTRQHVFSFLRASEVFIFVSFSMKVMYANRIVPDGTPRFAASYLGLFCLLTCMSNKKDDRLIWVNRVDSPYSNDGIIMKGLDPLRAKTTFIRKKFGHTAVSAIKASSVTL